MKLYIGVFVGALGLVLLLAGGNGSTSKLWSVLFGKSLPTKASGTGALAPLSAFGGLQPLGPPGQIQQKAFNGTNTMTGQGVTA